MITEKHILEEMCNIERNYPLFPGNTLSHATANECVARGWAMRDGNGYFIPTGATNAKDPATYKRELEREMNDPRNAHDYPRQEHLTRLWKMAHKRERKTGGR